MFNAIVRSKLLYGLERVHLTNAELSTLNAFQNKSLRIILHIPPTFIDREQTNASMYDKTRNDYGCSFEHFADTWRKAKFRLFGHILRASPADPLVQVTFKTDGLTPRAPTRRAARQAQSRLDN